MRIPAVVIIVVGSLFAAASADAQSSAACYSGTDSMAMRSCRDSIASKRQGPLNEGRTERLGAWTVRVTLDPLSELKTAIAQVSSQNKVGSPAAYAVLTFRCQSNGMEALISWGSISAENSNVALRVDTTIVPPEKWSLSGNNKATVWRGEVRKLAEHLKPGSTLFAQITPPNSAPIIARFPIGRSDEALKPIFDSCTQ